MTACRQALLARRSWVMAGAELLLVPVSGWAQPCKPGVVRDWPLWEQFKQRFIQSDGRVVDHSVAPGQTTSEGQSYAMFFALVHKDQTLFHQLWKWSQANLAQGDMKARLPAWLWGQRPDGSWGVVDENAASDADTWFAYALLEAGRLWDEKALTQSGLALLDRVAKEEVVDLPDLGKMLLPGPKGFVKTDKNGHKFWRLNPSYLPVMLFRRFALEQPTGPWAEIVRNTVALLTHMSSKSVAPDWVAYGKTAQGEWRFITDPDTPAVGSYDAIRTYMWAGMVDKRDDFRGTLLRRLSGIVAASNALEGVPPEFVSIDTGAPKPGRSPAGFSAALLPYFKSSGQGLLHRLALKRTSADYGSPVASAALPYYDHVLGLFGTGWDEDRYSFSSTGHLKPHWDLACPSKPER